MNGEDTKTNEVWGQLAQFEGYGRAGDSADDFVTLTFDDAKTKYKELQHAAHGMFYAKSDAVMWKLYPARAAVMMQMRFDGLLGFPGGLVDPGEDPTTALNRELLEEIGLDLDKYKFTDDNHVVSHLHKKKQLVLNFFVKEVTLADFKQIEINALNAVEHGVESMGNIRVPLYTMGDHFRGLPGFLTNTFCGNSRDQLLLSLVHTELLSSEEVKTALDSCKVYAKMIESKK